MDNNVTRHLDSTLKRDDWDILILHYLGLDHIGHISGPHSSLIGPKLMEMDDVIKKIHTSLISKVCFCCCFFSFSSTSLICPQEAVTVCDAVASHGSTLGSLRCLFVSLRNPWYLSSCQSYIKFFSSTILSVAGLEVFTLFSAVCSVSNRWQSQHADLLFKLIIIPLRLTTTTTKFGSADSGHAYNMLTPCLLW